MQTNTGRERSVYLVLGGAGAIGAAVCRQLHAAGAQVVIGTRNPDSAGEIADELGATATAVDATDWDAVEQCTRGVIDERGRLDGIANCVGSLLLKPAHATKPEEWDDIVAANLGSAFATVRAAGRALRKSGGSVVLVSSAAALTGLANHEAIAAVKAGIIGLTRSAAATYAGSGIRFNAVAPGMVRTPATADLLANAKAEAASIAMHPLGRLGEPDDVARAIVWLLSPEQTWVTGQVIGVDGGLSAVRSR
jgi:NAD(P)-dependent dehydrogenase (short-subunit alcohol dehydrogenase family)